MVLLIFLVSPISFTTFVNSLTGLPAEVTVKKMETHSSYQDLWVTFPKEERISPKCSLSMNSKVTVVSGTIPESVGTVENFIPTSLTDKGGLYECATIFNFFLICGTMTNVYPACPKGNQQDSPPFP